MKYCPLCEKTYPDESTVCAVDGARLRSSGPREDPFIGRVIKGRYRVMNTVGEGGMGTVYLAEQISIGRKVALKVLHGEYARDNEFVRRFHQEARMAAALNHRHVTTVFDFDQADDGSLFIVMEYLEGRSLSEVIRHEGALPVGRALRIGIQIAEGLEAAHRAGVIHRDVKPQNIMVVGPDREIKLMDFGIARMRDSSATHLTRAGMMMGTPEYMAPEQIEGGEVSEKTDIYAFGVVLYEMLTGLTPFHGATPAAVLTKHLREMPDPLRRHRREVPPAVEQVVMQALEKNPGARPRSMAEIVQALHELEGRSMEPAVPGTVVVAPTVVAPPSPAPASPGVPPLPAPPPPTTMSPRPRASPGTAVSAPTAVSPETMVAPGTVVVRRGPGRHGFLGAPRTRIGVAAALLLVAGGAVWLLFLGGATWLWPAGPAQPQKAALPVAPAPPTGDAAPAPPPVMSPEKTEEKRPPPAEPTPVTPAGREEGETGGTGPPRPADSRPRVPASPPRPSDGGAQPPRIAQPPARPADVSPPRPHEVPIVPARPQDSPPPPASQARVEPSPPVSPQARVEPPPPVPAPAPPDPARVRVLVEQRLRDGGLLKERGSDTVGVTVGITPDRVVTLTGVLRDREQRDRTVNLVRAVPGVKDVSANINLQESWR
jgi:serine/threonine protein kinase